jgi:DNA-binding SARP family transcriptional activator
MLEAAAPQVLHLYGGPFLAGESGKAWYMPMRNRLDGRFQRYALRLGEHWESRREWQRAAGLYQRVVELDPLAETFYRRQMACLGTQGLRAEAIEVYRRCRRDAVETLGVAPTSETDAALPALLTSFDRTRRRLPPAGVPPGANAVAKWRLRALTRPPRRRMSGVSNR